MQGTRRARIIQRGWYAHIRLRSPPVSPDVAPVGQCAGSTRLYSARSVLCLCAQGEGLFLYISRYVALLAPRIEAQPFLANRVIPPGSGDHGHRQYKARGRLWFDKFVRSSVFVVPPRKGKARMRVAVAMLAAQPPRTSRNPDVNLGRPRALARAAPS